MLIALWQFDEDGFKECWWTSFKRKQITFEPTGQGLASAVFSPLHKEAHAAPDPARGGYYVPDCALGGQFATHI